MTGKGGIFMEKQISIAVAGNPNVKDIAISPGATVRELLKVLNLEGYQLSRGGGEPLLPEYGLYEQTMNLEKLYATPQDVSVGEGG
jgi:hypothetical protein